MKNKLKLFQINSSHLFNILLLIFLTSILQACNFRPLYATYNNDNYIVRQLRQVELQPMDTISGAEFYNYFKDFFLNPTKPKYLLNLNFEHIETSNIVLDNSDIIRQSITQIITYQLLSKDSYDLLTSGKLVHYTSYSNISTPFNSYTEKEQALINMSRYAAADLRNKLILYFRSNSK